MAANLVSIQARLAAAEKEVAEWKAKLAEAEVEESGFATFAEITVAVMPDVMEFLMASYIQAYKDKGKTFPYKRLPGGRLIVADLKETEAGPAFEGRLQEPAPAPVAKVKATGNGGEVARVSTPCILKLDGVAVQASDLCKNAGLDFSRKSAHLVLRSLAPEIHARLTHHMTEDGPVVPCLYDAKVAPVAA